jgi:hypothetical protein
LERYLRKLFLLGDTDRNGVLDPQEIAVLLVQSGLDFSWRTVRAIMERADVNHDGTTHWNALECTVNPHPNPTVGVIDYEEFLPMMMQIIWADQRRGEAPAASEPIKEPHAAYYSLLARREATAPGRSQAALDLMVASKEMDIISSFLREDVWLANALPRGVSMFNHVAMRKATWDRSGTRGLEKELEAVQHKRAVHDRAKGLFRLLDTNRNLRLSQSQLASALGVELAQRFIAKMDADRDGRISLTEWMGFFEHMCDKAEAQDMPAAAYYKHVTIFSDAVLNRINHRQNQWGTISSVDQLPLDSSRGFQEYLDLI